MREGGAITHNLEETKVEKCERQSAKFEGELIVPLGLFLVVNTFAAAGEIIPIIVKAVQRWQENNE